LKKKRKKKKGKSSHGLKKKKKYSSSTWVVSWTQEKKKRGGKSSPTPCGPRFKTGDYSGSWEKKEEGSPTSKMERGGKKMPFGKKRVHATIMSLKPKKRKKGTGTMGKGLLIQERVVCLGEKKKKTVGGARRGPIYYPVKKRGVLP